VFITPYSKHLQAKPLLKSRSRFVSIIFYFPTTLHRQSECENAFTVAGVVSTGGKRVERGFVFLIGVAKIDWGTLVSKYNQLLGCQTKRIILLGNCIRCYTTENHVGKRLQPPVPK